MNDNPPEIATDEEVIVCESSRPGQVSIQDSTAISAALLGFLSVRCLQDFCEHRRVRVERPEHMPGLFHSLYTIYTAVWVDY